MKAKTATMLRAFALELIVYGILVAIYFLLVLHFIGPRLGDVADDHIEIYALLCVGLILGQSICLELLTTFLLRLFGGRSK
jgi:hypothetical protein